VKYILYGTNFALEVSSIYRSVKIQVQSLLTSLGYVYIQTKFWFCYGFFYWSKNL